MEENTVQDTPKTPGMSKTAIVVVLVIVVVLAAGAYQFTRTDSATMTATPSPVMTQVPAMEEVSETVYKDGTYTIEGDYLSPGGEEQIGVTVTLKGDVIEDVTVEPKATRPTSVKFQGVFSENYRPLVLGKNIDEVELDVVSGSSLTPKGFNDAIEKIKMQAKA